MAANSVWQRLINNPSDAEAAGEIALNLLGEQRYREAAAYFECAMALHPSPIFDLGRAKAWLEAGEYARAKGYFQGVLQEHPQSLEALAGMGNSHYRLGEWDEALVYYQALEPLLPEHAELRRTIARCHNKKLRLNDAISYFEASLALDPSQVGFSIELAWALYENNEPEGARKVFMDAMERFGPTPDIMYSYSLLLLQLGEWREAFPHYEQRWETTDPGDQYRRTTAPLTQPNWDGKASLQGKTVMAMIEQGAGDLLQFARYCWHLQQRGAIVDLLAPDFMLSIMKSMPWVRNVHTRYEAIPRYDYYVSLMSCPLFFDTTPETIPDLTPYLFAPYQRPRFSEKPTVGLVWGGSKTFLHDHHRSSELSMYEPLLEHYPDIDFISLQVGPRASEAAPWIAQGRLLDGSSGLGDYGDTAAALNAIDLLVTTCTSIVHLAGAMQRPACLLLSEKADWRWGNYGDSTSWYPSVKMYRQEKLGDWGPVIDTLKHDLPKQLEKAWNHMDALRQSH
jgi:tetratricopeptide (TPR) repeat protein